jgi:hypothetical protein
MIMLAIGIAAFFAITVRFAGRTARVTQKAAHR